MGEVGEVGEVRGGVWVYAEEKAAKNILKMYRECSENLQRICRKKLEKNRSWFVLALVSRFSALVGAKLPMLIESNRRRSYAS